MTEPTYRIDQIIVMQTGGKPTQYKIVGADCDDNGWTYYARTVTGSENGESTYFVRDYEVVSYWSDKTDSWVPGGSE